MDSRALALPFLCGFGLFLSLLATGAATQTDSGQPGGFSSKPPPETQQFSFVIGTWDLDVRYRTGPDQFHDYKAKWVGSWMVDGFVVHQDWQGPYTRGSEFRVYDREKGKWTGQNVYRGRSWARTEARFENGKMIVLNLDGKDKNGSFINRETYADISQKGFRVTSEKSYDGGETWDKGDYSIVAKRSEEGPSKKQEARSSEN